MEKYSAHIKPKDGGFLSPFLLRKFIKQNIEPIESPKNTNDGLLTKLNDQQNQPCHNSKQNDKSHKNETKHISLCSFLPCVLILASIR